MPLFLASGERAAARKGMSFGALAATLALLALSLLSPERTASSASGTAGPASSPPAAADTLSCLGNRTPLTFVNRMPFVDVTVGEHRGTFLLDLATNISTIDSARGASSCKVTELGERCSFAKVGFLGSSTAASLVRARPARGGLPEQAGILGTDLTSRAALAIDYVGKAVRRAEKETFCSDASLTGAGLMPLSAAGFFTNELSKRRLLAVDGVKVRVPNVPTVPIRVAGVSAHAQLDSGFDDGLVPFSVNVNEAYLKALMAASPGAFVRSPEKDLSLSTCAGVSEDALAYTLAPGLSIELVGDTGARTIPAATLFLKRTPDAAKKCGGIGTWSIPAAQIGATSLAELGLVVFDPFGSRVWVRGS